MVPLSVLDLSPIVAGATAADAMHNTLDLARHAERWGYARFWLAEHHNMPGIASAATAVMIGYVAGGTSTIRVGSGGIMLPNHSPLVIAEQFGTLASLYPQRIDLGLGRAPGTDRRTAHALRRDPEMRADLFPQDVQELQGYFADVQAGQAVRAVPGAGLKVPIWLLGSSLFSAQLAAALGLPFAFAAHFAPDLLMRALDLYRTRFVPSSSHATPHAMVGVSVIAAETDDEARRLFTSQQQQFVNLRRGMPTQLLPPVDSTDELWSPEERLGMEQTLRYAIVGSRERVHEDIRQFLELTSADELMVAAHIYDHTARLRSFELVSELLSPL